MTGLTVVEAYTSEDGSITLTCEQGEYTITIRTVPMKDENGNPITQNFYLGKTIGVKGIVDSFDGTWQVKVFTPENITIE